jgi:hypothetical protein
VVKIVVGRIDTEITEMIVMREGDRHHVLRIDEDMQMSGRIIGKDRLATATKSSTIPNSSGEMLQ